MSQGEVAEAKALHRQVVGYLEPSREEFPAALEAVGKLLFAYAVGQTTETAAKGRAAVYLEVVRDLPGWAVAQAVRKWLRHEAGDYDYHWPPMPPEFRMVCLMQTAPMRQEAIRLERLLNAAGSKDEPERTPEERQRVVDGFKSLSEILGGKPKGST